MLGAAAAALLLGGVIGGVTGLATTDPPGSEAAPPFPPEFPAGGEREYLPGVTIGLVADQWLNKANSFNCTDLGEGRTTHSQAKRVMECRPPGTNRDMYVRIEYDANDKVKMVDATCYAGLQSNVCRTFFAALAETVLSSQAGLREQAAQWAKENAGSERATTIGGIRLAANLDPNGMQVTPGV